MPEATHLSREAYAALIGKQLGVSDWITVTQDRIDQFAACTGDHQYIHTDPDRARDGPFGGTIAHGFLTLSLIGEMMQGLPRIEGVRTSVNYGLDRVRFIAPVPVNSRLRGLFVLASMKDVAPVVVETTLAITVEIEGAAKPALVAEWRAHRYLEEGS